jgi:hypothetical protein
VPIEKFVILLLLVLTLCYYAIPLQREAARTETEGRASSKLRAFLPDARLVRSRGSPRLAAARQSAPW